MQALERKASREDYLSTLNSFNKSCDDVIMNFTKEMGWTRTFDGSNMLKVSLARLSFSSKMNYTIAQSILSCTFILL